MENFDSVIEVIHEAICGYLEIFTSKADVEAAIKEDMSVMNISYTLEWQEVEDMSKMTIQGKYKGSYFFMEFYFMDEQKGD